MRLLQEQLPVALEKTGCKPEARRIYWRDDNLAPDETYSFHRKNFIDEPRFVLQVESGFANPESQDRKHLNQPFFVEEPFSIEYNEVKRTTPRRPAIMNVNFRRYYDDDKMYGVIIRSELTKKDKEWHVKSRIHVYTGFNRYQKMSETSTDILLVYMMDGQIVDIEKARGIEEMEGDSDAIKAAVEAQIREHVPDFSFDSCIPDIQDFKFCAEQMRQKPEPEQGIDAPKRPQPPEGHEDT
ncbi:MAG: hypothetical protein FWC53_03125 [Firmicutes bacterium]|nr:hypothetical protein [Bacillota bacterium]